MLSLFGLGDHPLATERLAARTRATDRDIRDAMQLGQRYGVYPGMTDFSVELAKRIGDWNLARGRAPSDPVPAEVRAELRTEVGREAFRKRFGREPLDASELSGFIVRASRPVRSGVSGYDATFSPVKSVSALWALADPKASEAIERCHDRAVADSRFPPSDPGGGSSGSTHWISSACSGPSWELSGVASSVARRARSRRKTWAIRSASCWWATCT